MQLTLDLKSILLYGGFGCLALCPFLYLKSIRNAIVTAAKSARFFPKAGVFWGLVSTATIAIAFGVCLPDLHAGMIEAPNPWLFMAICGGIGIILSIIIGLHNAVSERDYRMRLHLDAYDLPRIDRVTCICCSELVDTKDAYRRGDTSEYVCISCTNNR